jgi:hypothetical protein
MFQTSLLSITKTKVIALVLLFTSDPTEAKKYWQPNISSTTTTTTVVARQRKRG